MSKSRIALAVAVAVVVAAFWTVKTENYEFLHLDDPDFVLSNKMVKAGLSPKGLAWCFTNITENQYWHPLTWASLMTDASISDGSTESMSRVMHRHNALLQGLSAALLLLLMLQLLGNPTRKTDVALSVLLTLVWALHPLRAESVCWVTERKELLGTVYSLAALILWLKDSAWAKAAAVLACAAALLSKSVAVTLPAVFVALDFLKYGDFLKTIRTRWKLWLPLFALSAATALLTLITQRPALEGNQEGVTFFVKCCNGIGAYAVHCTRAIYPVNLFAHRPFINYVNLNMFLLGLVLVGTIFYATWRYFADGMRRQSLAAIGFLAAAWIGAGLLPMCGVIRVGIEMDPDRFGHWIGTGFVVVLALLIARIPQQKVRMSVCALLAALTVVYSAMAWRYAETFRNNYLFYLNTVKQSPDHAPGLGQLGCEYVTRFHDHENAIKFSEASLAIQMTEDVASQLITLLSERGRPEDCQRIKELTSGVILDHSLDDRGAALTALGVVAMLEHQWDEALSYLVDANARRRANGIPIDDNLLRIAECMAAKGDATKASELLHNISQSSKDPAIRRKAIEKLEKIEPEE